MRRMALCALLALGCGEERRSSDRSRLEGPLAWPATAEDYPLALAGDVLSITLMASGAPGDLLTVGVREAGGRVLVDPDAPGSSLNRVIAGHGRVVAMIPAAQAVMPLAAELLVSARGSGGGPLEGALWIKRGPMPAVQALPLAVLTAGAVVDTRKLDLALGEAGRIWRAAGIELGEPVRIAVADQPGLDLVAVDPALGGDSPQVGRALSLSARAPEGALALVVVGDVVVQAGGYPIWALAGGIPVPPVNGTPRSGVLVSAVLIGLDPVWAGQVMAHEIGHALGLYHTTEATLDEGGQSIGDGLDDTPLCPAAADRAPADGILSPAECDTRDAGNLMFWSAQRGATRLSDGQAAIARRSARTR